MRQTLLQEYPVNTKRITRGHSDLPKEEQKPIDSQSSQSQEEQPSNEPPKEKKIHHMTLKAMERKKKLAESGQLQPSSKSQNVQKIPKKRGRPKGFKVKKTEDKQDFLINEVLQISQSPQKKEIILRKRDPLKKIIDQDSQILQKELQMQQESDKNVQPVQIAIKLPEPKSQEVPIPAGPKKRGRKKKVVVDALPVPQPPALPAQKVYTIPKCQTYDNYRKYYDMIMQQKGDAQGEVPLIFNKFLDPEGYSRLLATLK